MALDSLHDLFLDELKDMYNAEKQITKALPKMAKMAGDPRLQRAFEKHLAQTERHVERLEKIFARLDESPRGKKCKGMEGVLEEGKDTMGEDADEAVMDAALIASAQRVEHYEIAAYGCLRSYAQLLGHDFAVKLIEQNLADEEATDELLTKLAEGGINEAAAAVGMDVEEM